MDNNQNIIAAAPANTIVECSPVHVNRPIQAQVEVIQRIVYTNGGLSKFYQNNFDKKKELLTQILTVHNIQNVPKIVDILIHDLDNICRNEELTTVFKCSDGTVHITRPIANARQLLLNNGSQVHVT